MAATDLGALFTRLRSILQQHANQFSVGDDTATSYCLEANPGPATLRAWSSKVIRSKIPVAWVQCSKTNVSFHLMSLYGRQPLLDGLSKELRARLHGKTCFTFRTVDERLFLELEQVTAEVISASREAGFIAE
jgi:hypothetical protein